MQSPTGPETRPFRFGVILDARTATAEGVAQTARAAAALGVNIALCTDHLGRWGMFTILQAAAAAADVRVGTFVANNDLRHPTVLAQQLMTLDAFTGGRLEVGLGAGWNAPEYAAAGIPFDPPAARLARLRISVNLIRQAMTEGRMTHPGDDAYAAIHQEALPRPLQSPPPLLVGGGGRRLLEFAAKHADIVGLNPRSLPTGALDRRDVTAEAVDRKIAWVQEAAGARWEDLEINIALYEVDPDLNRREGAPPRRAHDVSEREFRESPHFLGGSDAQMTEALIERRRRWGISYIALRPEHLESMAGVIRTLAGR